MEITKDERLAFLAALDKRVAPALKEAKNEARAEIMDAYAENGTDRKAILVGGEKVGEVGISYSKAAPYIYAEQTGAALEFLRQVGLVQEAPAKGWEEQFDLIGGKVVYKPTGEVVEWAGWNPKAAKSAAVRGCKPEDVLRAFGPRLQSMDAVALLDGEVE
jgi:hypothetical protein